MDITYQLIGVAPERLREDLKKTALSLRPLSDDEKASITVTRLRIAAAKEGETVEELGKRTGNRWKAAYTAMVNHISEKKLLRNGHLIKIAVEEPYRPR